MKPRLFLLENENALDLEPLTWSRPVFNLVSGTGTIQSRLKKSFRADLSGFWVRDYLAHSCEHENPGMQVNSFERSCDGRPWLIVDASWVPPEGFILPALVPHQGVCQGKVVYICLGEKEKPDIRGMQTHKELLSGWSQWDIPEVEVTGWQFRYLWDLVDKNPDLIRRDFAPILPTSGVLPSNVTMVGAANLMERGSGVEVEPFTVLDTRNGPIVLEAGVKIQAFSRIEGPCWLGANTIIYGARIKAGTSIGPCCRVGGEIENAIFQGYGNKYHEGFLGHSYLGEWVNLGAGTISSDLRNDYAPIRVVVGDSLVDTGKIKVGAFLGDHVRTGIGTLMNAGTKAGIFSQLLPGDGYLSRNIPSFTTSSGSSVSVRSDIKSILEVAVTVSSRRQKAMPLALANLYESLFSITSRERSRMFSEAGIFLNRKSA